MGALGPLCRAVERLDGAGLLADDTTYIHCSNLTDDALARLVDTGGTFSISAPVEATLGLGTPPFDRLADLGARPSLSADIETASGGDMFGQLRTAWAVARLTAHRRAAAGDKPVFPTVRDLLAFATIEGARACGLDHRIGSITVGKQADLVLLDLARLNVAPANDTAGAIVQSADTSNVAWVFVAGRAVKAHGQLVDAGMAPRALGLAVASRDHLYQAAGALPGTQASAGEFAAAAETMTFLGLDIVGED
jgi:cytosine/adenosine deaminase-related metal-dependent hydrolase